jgi:LacI family transcriptional regulator
MMRGEKPNISEILIEPLGVVTRGSTDVLAVEDPDIAAAVRMIRDNALRGIQVSDLIDALPMSRRVLESRFKQLIGRTPHQEIERVRINEVKRYLLETDMTLTAIAHRTGFKHVEYMCVAFKRATGCSPGKFRGESGR